MKTAEKRPGKPRASIPPTPQVQANTLDALMLDVIEWAVTNYCRAKERATQSYARFDDATQGRTDTESWETWTDQAQGMFNDAEDRLISTVLLACGRIRRHHHMKEMRGDIEPCCLTYNGTFYIVARVAESEDSLRLTIVKPSEIKGDRRAKR